MEYPSDTVLKWILLAFLLWTSASVRSASVDEEGLFGDDGGKRLVCYYANWAIYRPGVAKFTPENIDPYLCTHVIYAFAGMNKDFELKPFDSYNDVQLGNYKKFTNLKTYNPKLKTMIAVGGWNEGSKRFSKLVESVSSRRRFVRAAISFLRKHSLDGLDLDWEYPGSRDGGRDQDKEGYTKLVQELREAFDGESLTGGRSRLLLTMAVPAGKQYIDKGYDVPQLAKHLDFLNLLTYDYHTGQEAEVRHHAPLRQEPGLEEWSPNRQLNIEWTVQYYLDLGCPARKLVLGMPTYGRSFTLEDPEENEIGSPAKGPGEQGDATREAGYLAYYEICQMIQDKEWDLEAPYADLMGPYAYKEDQWVGFDDEDIIVEKVKFIYRKGLGGGMVWTLDNDDFRGRCYGEPSPLVSTLKASLQTGKAILRQTTQSTPSTTQSTPKSTTRRTTKKPPVFTTPEPPTPFECEDEGFFNHPNDCKKYFWCLDSPQGLVPHAFTCPSGLFFNKHRDSCDYANNVPCKKKTTSTTPPTTTHKPRPRPKKKTTTTTTTEASTTTRELSNEVAAPSIDKVMDGQSLTELLQLLQRLGVDQLHDKLQGRETSAPASSSTLPPYRTPNRRTTAPTEASSAVQDPFLQYARPDRGSQSSSPAGGARDDKGPAPRGPQGVHDPAPEAPEANLPEEDEEEDEETPGGGFRFVYHTPSRQRGGATEKPAKKATEAAPPEEAAEEDEIDEDDVTTPSKPERRRVVVRVRPIPGEKRRPNRYLPAQTVGVRQEVRHTPNDVTEKPITTTTTTGAPPRQPATRRPRPAVTRRPSTSTSAATVPSFRGPAPRRELIVLPSGKPAVPATTRRRPRPSLVPDSSARGPGLGMLADGGVTCLRRGVHPHPRDCAKFVVCVPSSEGAGGEKDELDGFIHECPGRTQFREEKGRCMPAANAPCTPPTTTDAP